VCHLPFLSSLSRVGFIWNRENPLSSQILFRQREQPVADAGSQVAVFVVIVLQVGRA
jgi:hypothetical protein